MHDSMTLLQWLIMDNDEWQDFTWRPAQAIAVQYDQPMGRTRAGIRPRPQRERGDCPFFV